MLLFGQLDRNSTKQAIQKTLKSAARTVFFVEFRANCHNQSIVWQNPVGLLSRQDKKEQHYDLLKVISEDSETWKQVQLTSLKL